MIDKTKPIPPTSVVRVRFVTAIRLGTHELQAWHADKTPYLCEASPAGLVFAPLDTSPLETVVPWANIVSYERGRRTP